MKTDKTYIIVLLALWSLVARSTWAVWDIETVDSGGDVGWYSSVALTGANQPRISYYDYTNTNLKFAEHNGASWQITTVDSNRSCGDFSSLKLDGAGNPHITYRGSGLRYARWNGSSWQLEQVNSTTFYHSTSLALETGGQRHVAYSSSGSTGGTLYYIYYNGTAWESQLSLTASGSPMESSLALDSSNMAHIAYFGNADNIYYGQVNGTTWNADGPPATGDNDGYWPALDIANDGTRHVSYWSWTNSALDYRRHNGSSWEAVQTLDSIGDVGWYSALVTDNANAVHISYHDNTSWDLKYVTNSSGSWVTQIVDAPGGVGYSTSITLDTGGNPHISYYDVSNSDLKYARWVPGPHTLQGVIRDGSAVPAPGVYVFLTGNGIESNAITASDGSYSFASIPAGDYVVVPILAGWVFSPTQRSYAGLNQSYTAQDFTMVAGTGHFIRGYVIDNQGYALDQVLVTLAGDTQGSYTTDTTGYYEFINIADNGNYTVTPSLSGYVFSPSVNAYTNLSADQDSQNFTGFQSSTIQTVIDLNGFVVDSNGNGVAGVQVDLTGTNIINSPGTTVTAQAITNGNGYYAFPNQPPGDFRVQVSKTNWRFFPDERNYRTQNADLAIDIFTGVFQASLPGSDEIRVIGNLFNSKKGEYTTVWFTLAQRGSVRMRIYSLDGILVKTLIDETRDPGLHSLLWHGRNQNGQLVASGIYFLDIQMSGQRKMIKLCVVK